MLYSVFFLNERKIPWLGIFIFKSIFFELRRAFPRYDAFFKILHFLMIFILMFEEIGFSESKWDGIDIWE